jgi:membrane protein insertase Oxa1/YidC/SpoIIIJ
MLFWFIIGVAVGLLLFWLFNNHQTFNLGKMTAFEHAYKTLKKDADRLLKTLQQSNKNLHKRKRDAEAPRIKVSIS